MIVQAQIISKILNTQNFSIVTVNNLTENYFFNYKAEFNYIKNHYAVHKCVPDKLTFLNIFPDFDIVDVSEPDSYLLEQLLFEFTGSALAESYNKVRRLLTEGKYLEAKQLASDSARELDALASPMSCTNIMKDTSRYDRYLEKASNPTKYYVSTGFEELDKLIGGIDRENELMTIVARTGRGKSWLLFKMCLEVAKQGLRVGLYEGEISVDKVAFRIDTLNGHISNADLMRGNLFVKDTYKAYINSLNFTDYNLLILTPDSIQGPATVSALRSFVEKENLDILFVDQYSLLEDEKQAKAEHEHIANISKALKRLQVEKRIPIIAVSQLNRTKVEDQTAAMSIDTTMIAGSDRIGQDSTSIIGLERKEDRLSMHIIKARDGGDEKTLQYQVDLNYGNFKYIPSEHDGISTPEQLEALKTSYETPIENSTSTEGTPF